MHRSAAIRLQRMTEMADAMLPDNVDEDPKLLAQAIDEALDDLEEALKAGDAAAVATMLASAQALADSLLQVLGGTDIGDQ